MGRNASATLLGLLSACSGSHLTPVTEPQAEERLRQMVARGAAPAVVAATVRDGQVALLSGGRSDLQSGERASAETRFLWFSVTKVFTATAVMQLAERGRLDLDRPVAEILPSFAVENPYGGEVTVRHLLSHTGGLANPIPVSWIHLASEAGPGLDEMTGRLLARHRRLAFRPGSRFGYSNLGYLVLGQVVEKAGGQPYPEYVRDHILAALGCSASGFDAGGRTATGYTRRWSVMGLAGRFLVDRRFFADPSGDFLALRPFRVDGAPYGGLVGTVPDLARFLAAHLAGGILEGRRILTEASALAMRTPQRDLRGRPLPVGLGWHLGEIDGQPYAYHLGGGAGFKSELRLYPRLGYGVAVVANETSFDTGSISRLVPLDRP